MQVLLSAVCGGWGLAAPRITCDALAVHYGVCRKPPAPTLKTALVLCREVLPNLEWV